MLRVRSGWTGTAQGLPYLSTLYFAGETAAEAQFAATAVRTFWAACQGLITNTLSVAVQPEVAVIDAATGDTTDVHAVATAGVTGTNVQDPLPWATQGLVRLTTGAFVGGRRVTGHLYIPGAGESSNTFGRADLAYTSPIATAMGTLIADANSILCVWSRPKTSPVAVPGSVHNVLSATVSTNWSILRSRRD